MDIDRACIGGGLIATLHRHIGLPVGLMPLPAVGHAPFYVIETPVQVGPRQHDIVWTEDRIGEPRAESRAWGRLYNDIEDAHATMINHRIGHERHDGIVVGANRFYLAVGIGQTHRFGQVDALLGYQHGIAVDILLLLGYFDNRSQVLLAAFGAIQRQVFGTPHRFGGSGGQRVFNSESLLKLLEADGTTLGNRVERGAFLLIERYAQDAIAVGLRQFPSHVVVGSPTQRDTVGRRTGHGLKFVYYGLGCSQSLAAVGPRFLCMRCQSCQGNEQGCNISSCSHSRSCYHNFG